MSHTIVTNLLNDTHDAELQIENRVLLYTVNWPSDAPPYTSGNTATLDTPYIDITPRALSWSINSNRKSTGAVFSGTFAPDEYGDTGFSTDYNNYIEVYQRIKSASYDSGYLKLGTFLVDVSRANAEILPGDLALAARDPMKMMQRRAWTGLLEPDKITHTDVTLTRRYVSGMEYYEFYDGASANNHTINWTPSPTAKLWTMNESDMTKDRGLPVDGENVVVLAGLGLVRINKTWFDEEYTSKKADTIVCTYHRYALWEDTFVGTYYLNSPEEIIRTMAEYAGFQGFDSSLPFYINAIEPVTLPSTPTAVYKYDGIYTDLTNEASNDATADVTFCEVVGDALYIGVWEQKFAGIHYSLDVNMDSGSIIHEYWNGSTWIELTLTAPNIDTTIGLTQTGFVSWRYTNLGDWERSVPHPSMIEAYWVRVRCGATPTIAPIATSVLPGFTVQCVTPRYTTNDDMKPLNILDRLVKSFVMPNYYWYCDENGNFNATHVYQQSSPDYTINTLVSADSDPIRDDQIFTTVYYRGRQADRFNAAAMINGGSIIVAPTLPTESLTLVGATERVIDGSLKKEFDMQYPSGSAPVEPQDILILRLAGTIEGAELYEVQFDSSLVPTYELVDESNMYTGKLVTDTRNDNAYLIPFSPNIQLTKIRIYVEDVSNSKTYIEVYTGVGDITDAAGWQQIDVLISGTSVSGVWHEYTLNIPGVSYARLRIVPKDTRPQGSFSGWIKITDLEFYTLGITEPIGVEWTSYPDANFHANAHDGSLSSGSIFDDYGTYVNAHFTEGPITRIILDLAVGGGLELSYKVSGNDDYSFFTKLTGLGKQNLVFADLLSGNSLMSGNSDWLTVTDLRFMLTDRATSNELSEIEIWMPESNPEYPACSIYYTTTDEATWDVLPKCENINLQAGANKFSKDNFGEQIYAKALKIVCERWGHWDDKRRFKLLEIKAWCGDTIYGSASYGETFPYIQQAHIDFAAKMGWPSYTAGNVDDTANTQKAVDYAALQLLREFTRVWTGLRVIGFRPDAKLGDTIAIESYIKDRLSLTATVYVVEEVETSNEGVTTVSLMPFL
jgi:hypothetical protein